MKTITCSISPGRQKAEDGMLPGETLEVLRSLLASRDFRCGEIRDSQLAASKASLHFNVTASAQGLEVCVSNHRLGKHRQSTVMRTTVESALAYVMEKSKK